MPTRASLAFALALVLASSALAQTPGKRLPPPSDQQLAEAKKLIAELYRNDYTKASTPALKLLLASKLIEDAKKTNDDPTSKYALLIVARDIAARRRRLGGEHSGDHTAR